MTSCTSTMGLILSACCWAAFMALTSLSALRAAPTRSSWPSAVTPHLAAMDLSCSTLVCCSLVLGGIIYIHFHFVGMQYSPSMTVLHDNLVKYWYQNDPNFPFAFFFLFFCMFRTATALVALITLSYTIVQRLIIDPWHFSQSRKDHKNEKPE